MIDDCYLTWNSMAPEIHFEISRCRISLCCPYYTPFLTIYPEVEHHRLPTRTKEHFCAILDIIETIPRSRRVYGDETTSNGAMAPLHLYCASRVYQGEGAPDRLWQLCAVGLHHQRIFLVCHRAAGRAAQPAGYRTRFGPALAPRAQLDAGIVPTSSRERGARPHIWPRTLRRGVTGRYGAGSSTPRARQRGP